MGKLNVTPRGISSGNSSGHARQPSCTTSAMHLPIHAKRASASCIFSCSPMGQDFSKCLLTRDRSTSCPFSSGFPEDVEFFKEFCARPRSSINPTLKFVPPLTRRQVEKCPLSSRILTYQLRGTCYPCQISSELFTRFAIFSSSCFTSKQDSTRLPKLPGKGPKKERGSFLTFLPHPPPASKYCPKSA